MMFQPNSQKIACPACHASEGISPRTVFGQFWVRRCSACPFYTTEPLPTIEKKLIYLDQLVLSNILSAKDARWAEVHQRLNLLTWLQIVTCPYSPIHVEESLLASQSHAELKGLYRDLSGGDKFLTPDEIIQNQLLDAVGRYLDPAQPPLGWPKTRPWRNFAKQNPHRWTTDLMVFAEFPTDLARIARIQQHKDKLHADLQAVADNWKEETYRFQDDVEREACSYYSSLLAVYRALAQGRKSIEAACPPELLPALHACLGPQKFDPDTPPGLQPGVMLVHWLAAEVYKSRPDEADPVGVVEQFFQSPEAMNVPFQYIASRLWATIAQGVRSRTPRQSKSSDNYDVTAISTYAPYCDAMVVDNEFCAMASQKNIDVPGQYGVKIFSARKLPEFVEYLDDLLMNIPEEHRRALKEVYPHLSNLPWLHDKVTTSS